MVLVASLYELSRPSSPSGLLHDEYSFVEAYCEWKGLLFGTFTTFLNVTNAKNVNRTCSQKTQGRSETFFRTYGSTKESVLALNERPTLVSKSLNCSTFVRMYLR